jgi:hypothetical protein
MQYTNFRESKIRIVRSATKQQRYFVVLATEDPTGVNRQCLLMQGKTGKRDTVPLLLYDDSSVKNIVGSVLVRVRDNELCGVIAFASDREAQQVRARYLAGELTCSLITRPISGIQLERGETFLHVIGPAQILTQWEPLQIVLS